MEFGSLEVKEIGRFIRTRREGADPDRFRSLPPRRRHIPHLTQGDLAELAGVSSEVVSQIEQARYPNLNPSILKRLAQAMHVPHEQQMYIIGLLDQTPHAPSRKTIPGWVHDITRETAHPVAIINPCLDILAWNQPLAALLGDFSQDPPAERNVAVSMFCSPEMEERMVGIEHYRTNLLSGLKMWLSLHPAYRQHIRRLVDTLEHRSEAFRLAWESADPFTRPSMNKTLNHPELGVMHVREVIGEILGEDGLFKIEFFAADDETRAKMQQL